MLFLWGLQTDILQQKIFIQTCFFWLRGNSNAKLIPQSRKKVKFFHSWFKSVFRLFRKIFFFPKFSQNYWKKIDSFRLRQKTDTFWQEKISDINLLWFLVEKHCFSLLKIENLLTSIWKYSEQLSNWGVLTPSWRCLSAVLARICNFLGHQRFCSATDDVCTSWATSTNGKNTNELNIFCPFEKFLSKNNERWRHHGAHLLEISLEHGNIGKQIDCKNTFQFVQIIQ